jgi:hypothetical protein
MTTRNRRLDRDLRLQRQAIEALNTLDWMARDYGLSHNEIMARTELIRGNMAPTRRSVKSYVEGYYQCVWDRWFRQDLVFAHVAPDGSRYSGHRGDRLPEWANDVNPLYAALRGAEIVTWPSGYFWRKSGKPFSELNKPRNAIDPTEQAGIVK